jgi:hypothetical protein
VTTCETCRYALHNMDGIACHRNPPPWPLVWPHNWCGEWAAKQTKPTEPKS